MVYKSGIAIITKGLTENNLNTVYKYAKNCINSRLYLSVKGFSPYNGDWKVNISTCYNVANKVCPNLDVRLLLPYSNYKINDKEISVVICDDLNVKYENVQHLIEYVSERLPEIFLNFEGYGESVMEIPKDIESKFSYVCLGGTFDRLHNGHKILLSLSALMTHEKLFCGVSEDELIKDKFLTELIEPLSNRINNCLSFLQDIKPNIHYTVSPIHHPFGPTIENPNFDCIVGSVETQKGCERINESRLKKGFLPLHVELIDLIDEKIEDDFDQISPDHKVSSSKNRLRSLGQLLKSPTRTHFPGKPYVIGLTGGIASGKSSIGNKLKSFGAEVIDCDKLGHEAYLPGSDCFNKLVTVFGNDIVNPETGMVNRAALGAIVFQNPSEMKKLTDIVWPAIADLAKKRIESIEELIKNSDDQKRIIVIDAAVLLDAGWEKLCNEIWVSFIPREEAVERLKNRNKLSSADAMSRIDSQKSNRFYVGAAHVAFCTMWSYEFTHRQLQQAWHDLFDRLNVHLNQQ